MIHKAWLLLIPAALGLLIASQWPDIRRYLKIKQLSQGQGHPENVPVGEPAQGIRLAKEVRSTCVNSRLLI